MDGMITYDYGYDDCRGISFFRFFGEGEVLCVLSRRVRVLRGHADERLLLGGSWLEHAPVSKKKVRFWKGINNMKIPNILPKRLRYATKQLFYISGLTP